jgi:anti-sigma B factor antagonist
MPATTPGIASVRHEGDALVVGLRGTLGFATVPAIRVACERLIDEHRPKRLIINVADVGYVDSAGVAMLVALRRRMLNDGATVIVAEPQPMVREMFEVVKLSRLMPIEASEAAALAREVEA